MNRGRRSAEMMFVHESGMSISTTKRMASSEGIELHHSRLVSRDVVFVGWLLL